MKKVLLFFLIINILPLRAQDKTNLKPYSFSSDQYLKRVNKVHSLKALDLERIYFEDSIQFSKSQQFNIARFRKLEIFEIKKKDAVFINESKAYWKQQIQVPESKALALKIEKIILPKGSQLYIYSNNEKDNFLFFDASEQAFEKSNFISKKINASDLVIEYNSNEANWDSVKISIEGLVNYYERQIESNPGFKQSTDCEVNMACSEGELWCNESQSVVRILIQAGPFYSYCSGSLINNTKKDFTPYILTAEHCGEGSNDEDFKYWKFDFHYESQNCASPNNESEIFSNSISGCEQIAKSLSVDSDFRLIKLLHEVPQAWSAYYAGWNIEEQSRFDGGGVGIHHPYGDIKKISTFSKDLFSSDSNGGHSNDLYYTTYWEETENGHGITEGGSSGSPLFSNEGLIIGTLSTGTSYCDSRKVDPDFYGKISKHWAGDNSSPSEQLKVWLDPLNTGQTKLGGLAGNDDIDCGERLFFNNFTIFPNPAKSVIRIGNGDLVCLSGALVQIYSSNGTLTLSETLKTSISTKSIDVSMLAEGVYILRIINSSCTLQDKFVILR